MARPPKRFARFDVSTDPELSTHFEAPGEYPAPLTPAERESYLAWRRGDGGGLGLRAADAVRVVRYGRRERFPEWRGERVQLTRTPQAPGAGESCPLEWVGESCLARWSGKLARGWSVHIRVREDWSANDPDFYDPPGKLRERRYAKEPRDPNARVYLGGKRARDYVFDFEAETFSSLRGYSAKERGRHAAWRAARAQVIDYAEEAARHAEGLPSKGNTFMELEVLVLGPNGTVLASESRSGEYTDADEAYEMWIMDYQLLQEALGDALRDFENVLLSI